MSSRMPQLRSGQPVASAAFTGVLIKHEIAVSMDGKSAWRDNVFVEQLHVGAAVYTRRCICGPTKASATPALRSAAAWAFTLCDVHTRALTAKHQITPTSRCCLPAWQPNPGRGSTYRSDKNCSDNRLQL